MAKDSSIEKLSEWLQHTHAELQHRGPTNTDSVEPAESCFE